MPSILNRIKIINKKINDFSTKKRIFGLSFLFLSLFIISALLSACLLSVIIMTMIQINNENILSEQVIHYPHLCLKNDNVEQCVKERIENTGELFKNTTLESIVQKIMYTSLVLLPTCFLFSLFSFCNLSLRTVFNPEATFNDHFIEDLPLRVFCPFMAG